MVATFSPLRMTEAEPSTAVEPEAPFVGATEPEIFVDDGVPP